MSWRLQQEPRLWLRQVCTVVWLTRSGGSQTRHVIRFEDKKNRLETIQMQRSQWRTRLSPEGFVLQTLTHRLLSLGLLPNLCTEIKNRFSLSAVTRTVRGSQPDLRRDCSQQSQWRFWQEEFLSSQFMTPFKSDKPSPSQIWRENKKN